MLDGIAINHLNVNSRVTFAIVTEQIQEEA